MRKTQTYLFVALVTCAAAVAATLAGLAIAG